MPLSKTRSIKGIAENSLSDPASGSSELLSQLVRQKSKPGLLIIYSASITLSRRKQKFKIEPRYMLEISF
jgi:hypothetical protein